MMTFATGNVMMVSGVLVTLGGYFLGVPGHSGEQGHGRCSPTPASPILIPARGLFVNDANVGMKTFIVIQFTYKLRSYS